MDEIRFQTVSTEHWFGDAIHIEINGVRLVDLLREFEAPMALAEGSPDLAGGYVGIGAASHLPPSQHFLGIPNAPLPAGAKADLLWCGSCGESGCWPWRARIEADDDRVAWSQFEQPHRTPRGRRAPWVYDDFGPFVFSRPQYESALRAATRRA